MGKSNKYGIWAWRPLGLDAYTVDFHQCVRAGYHELVKLDPQRWRVVDAGQKWNVVQHGLREIIAERLKSSPKD